MVKCQVCDKDDVITYNEKEQLCPACCAVFEHYDGETGHQYEYERSERTHLCKYCGLLADSDFYEAYDL